MRLLFPTFLVATVLTALTPQGCQTAPTPAQPARAAQLDVEAANTKLDAKQGEQLQKIRDGVEGVKAGNAAQPLGPATDAVESESERIAELTGKQPSEKGKKEAEERVALRLAGKVAEAERLYALERAATAKLAKELQQATKDVQTANAAMELARQQAEKEKQELIKAANDKEVAFMTKLIAGLGAVLLLAAIGLAIFLFQTAAVTPKSLGVVVLLFVGSLLVFAIIPLLAHPWVPYVLGGLILLCVIAALIVFLSQNAETQKRFSWAQDGLKRGASFVSDLRHSDLPPEVVEKVVTMYDVVLDKTHQEYIKAAGK